MRDIAYEQAIFKHYQKMLTLLEEFSLENPDTWKERDLLAIQRTLQIFIESFIGFARYFVQQKYQLSVGQSREAVEELKHKGDLTFEQYRQILKIIGFRNVLVHDYLDVDEEIVRNIIRNKNYLFLNDFFSKWQQELNLKSN